MPREDHVPVTPTEIRKLADALVHFSERYQQMAGAVEKVVGDDRMEIPSWKNAVRGLDYLRSAVNRAQAFIEGGMLQPIRDPIVKEANRLQSLAKRAEEATAKDRGKRSAKGNQRKKSSRKKKPDGPNKAK